MSEKLETIKEKIIEGLKTVYDPEIPANIYDLGMVYEINLDEQNDKVYCEVIMTLTSPTCPVADTLVDQVSFIVSSTENVYKANVQLVFDPPWDESKMSEEAREIMAAHGAAMFF